MGLSLQQMDPSNSPFGANVQVGANGLPIQPYKAPDINTEPVRPDFISQLDPVTGLLKSPYVMEGKYADINLNTDGLDAVRQRALAQGPSAWANLMLQQQGIQNQASREAAIKQSLSGDQQAQANLAMQGGLSSGARERMAMQSSRDLNQTKQTQANQANLANLGIQTQDETMRQNALMQLPGMEIASLQPAQNNRLFQAGLQQYDIQNALQDVSQQNASNLASYTEAMKGYAANQQSQAQAQQSGGGSWVCTEIEKQLPFEKFDKECLIKMSKYTTSIHPIVGKFYFFRCRVLVDKMKEAKVDFKEFKDVIASMIFKIKFKEMEAAYDQYKEFVMGLISKYWPDCDDVVYQNLLLGKESDLKGESHAV